MSCVCAKKSGVVVKVPSLPAHLRAQPGIPNTAIPNGVPRYIIDLDLPPLERYRCLIGDYKEHFKAVDTFVNDTVKAVSPMVGALVMKCLQGVLSLSNKLSVVYYSEELAAIAELSGMPLGRVVMMQLVYEACALCTSVIVPRDAGGNAAHIRTMDWEMDFLRNLTVEAEFRKGGKTLAVSSTWAGYVGILTGVAIRPQQGQDGFAVSVNLRSENSGTFATNLRCALARAWPIGFLVRESLMRCTGYAECVSWLTHSKLIAPCYFTVSGAGSWRGTLITRGRNDSLRPLNLAPPSEESRVAFEGSRRSGTVKGQTKVPCLVQPNMDHWSNEARDDILCSQERRCLASEAMRRLVADETLITNDALWQAMSVHPIVNEITIYGTLMDPSTGTIETRLPHRVGRKVVF